MVAKGASIRPKKFACVAPIWFKMSLVSG